MDQGAFDWPSGPATAVAWQRHVDCGRFISAPNQTVLPVNALVSHGTAAAALPPPMSTACHPADRSRRFFLSDVHDPQIATTDEIAVEPTAVGVIPAIRPQSEVSPHAILTAAAVEPALARFAQRLQHNLGAQRVLLFGSRARGQHRTDSDYDVIVVSPSFAGMEAPRRAVGLRQLWYDAGGHGPLDLLCMTPEEFHLAQQRISLIAAVLPESIDLLAPEVIAAR